MTNLINNQNNTTSDTNIWLAPLLSDVEKIEKGRSNLIIMDYAKGNKIGGINFYNYTKTPERGVREIEIYLDNYLLYRVSALLFRDTSESTIRKKESSTPQSASPRNSLSSKT